MRERHIVKYESFDGQTFDTAGACRQHERDHAHKLLVGLTLEQVEAALNRTDPERAEAFEIVGSKIAQARREAGELKRIRRNDQGVPVVTAEEYAALVERESSGATEAATGGAEGLADNAPNGSAPPTSDEEHIPETLRRTA